MKLKQAASQGTVVWKVYNPTQNVEEIMKALTTVVCIIFGQPVKLKIQRFNKDHPGHEMPVNFTTFAVQFFIALLGLMIIQIVPLQSASNLILGVSGAFVLCSSVAAKESFGNFIAGFMLAIHKPFGVGDTVYLKAEGVTGTVKEITFRHTVIISDNGTKVTIPNMTMNSISIEDLSYADKAGKETKPD